MLVSFDKSTFLAGLVVMATRANAFDAELEFNYLPVAHVRTDPIISDTCLSDHVHTFYGPPRVEPYVTTDDLIATDSSQHTGLVEENKSLYWHPTIYKYNPVTGIYTMDEVFYTSVYYFWNTNDETFAFPKGFRMIAKDHNAFTECTVGSFKTCTRSGDDSCNAPSDNFFPRQACDMLEITMDFPSCWNGDIDSLPNHDSHVIYPIDDDGVDVCPSTHPKKIPTVSISIQIQNYDGGWHTWSDETNKFHADYLSGWDVPLMEKFLVGCAEDVEECHQFVTFKNGPTGCDSHQEKHDKLVAVLPPLPDTTSITPEAVDNISVLPRGLCQDSSDQPDPDQPDPDQPSEPPAGCADDATLQFQNDPTRDCSWVSKRPGRRCGKSWEGRKLFEFCPVTCDECPCEDDPDFLWQGKPNRGCDWVAARPGRRCGKEVGDGRLVSEVCLVACDECE